MIIRNNENMCFSRLLFFFCFILVQAVTPTVAQHVCSGGNYTSNSTYGANLNSVMASMSSNTEIDYGFYNFSAGEDPDKVNAIALCKGDISTDECRSCVNSTSFDLLHTWCPNQKEAVIWPDKCMIRYSNRYIFGVMESSPGFQVYALQNASNVEGFNQALRILLAGLRNNASLGNSTRKFAKGSAAAPAFETINALVQCTPDLDQLECSDCLSATAELILVGSVGGRYGTPSCGLWYQRDVLPPAASPPPPALLPPAASPPPPPPTEGKKSKSSSSVIVIVVATVVSVVVIICICICIWICFYLRVKKAGEKVESKPEIVSGQSANEISSIESLQFDFGTIKVATENFSNANKLGQGGFGVVYKGKLPNGQEIAVKRLLKHSKQGNLEFKNEVVLVARLQHRNLVRLIGFSLEGNERLLIYEFLPNASLDKFIFDPIKRLLLDWERCYKIIEGVARGILYLHEDSQLRIIHRDLKPSNILLDANMNPKISDFGTAKLFVLDQSQDNTKNIMGTYGYMPPEYVIYGRFSVKSDVFSFGVLILEMLSGTKLSSFRKGESEEGLLSYAWKHWRKGTALNLIDPTLRAGSTIEILRCINIGLLCVQENEVDRPTMASVVLMLNGNSITLSVPKKPAFLMDRSTVSDMSSKRERNIRVIRSDASRSNSVEASINEASITEELYPR